MMIITLILLILYPSFSFSEEAIPLLPERTFDRLIIYETLFVIWVFIGALCVVLYMKLKEAKRVEDLKLDKEEENVPFLE